MDLSDSTTNVNQMSAEPGSAQDYLPTIDGAPALSGDHSNQSSAGSSSALLDPAASRNERARVAKHRMSKIPRPPNAFILYRQHYHPIVKASQPGLHNNQISVILGNQWKNESITIKDYYKKKAEDLAREHKVKYPDYQYQPRKPSEKKHRKAKSQVMSSSGPATSATAPAGPNPAFALPAYNSAALNMSVFNMPAFTPPVPATQQMIAPPVIPNFELDGNGDMIFDLYPGCESMLGAMVTKHNASGVMPQQSNVPNTYYIAAEPTQLARDDYAWSQSIIETFDGCKTAEDPTDPIIVQALIDYEEHMRAAAQAAAYRSGVDYRNMIPGHPDFPRLWNHYNNAVMARHERLEAECRNGTIFLPSASLPPAPEVSSLLNFSTQPTPEGEADLQALFSNVDSTSSYTTVPDAEPKDLANLDFRALFYDLFQD